MNGDQIFGLILIATFGVIVPFGLAWVIPAAKARARRIEAEAYGRGDPELAAEVEQLRVRVAEMEERLDFAERMLAQQAAPPALRSVEGLAR